MPERRGTIVGMLGGVETKKSELGGSMKSILKSVKTINVSLVRPLVVPTYACLGAISPRA